MKPGRMLLPALALAVLFAGCAPVQTDVGGDATMPVQTTASPNPQPTADPTPTPPAEATPAPEATPAWPARVSGFFLPQAVPEDYIRPVHLSEEGNLLLYATSANSILLCRRAGAVLETVPVVEKVNIGPGSSLCMDEAGGRLYVTGNRPGAAEGAPPAVVMVALENGARCYLDELVGWNEKGYAFSNDFQACGGKLLVRLLAVKDGQTSPSDRWAAVSPEEKAVQILDFKSLAEKALPQWQKVTAVRPALAHDGTVLVVCRVQGRLPQETPAEAAGAAGGDGAPEQAGVCVLRAALSGEVLGTVEFMNETGRADALRLWDGKVYGLSPDGRHLLYGGASSGLFLYDTGANAEFAVLEDGAEILFANWGAEGHVYCGAAQGAGDALLYKLTLDEITGSE